MSLRRREDRRRLFLSQIPEGIPVLLSYEIGEGYDHVNMTARSVDGMTCHPWKMPNANKWWARHLRLGEIACALNHLACWEHAFASNLTYSVFFEDDAMLAKGFWDRLPSLVNQLGRLDPSWSLLYLGRENLGGDSIFSENFVIPGFSYCTYAYALSHEGLKLLRAYDLRKKLMPLDEFLIASYRAHPRHDVAALISPLMRAYAVNPQMAFERDDKVYGSDTEDSSECVP